MDVEQQMSKAGGRTSGHVGQPGLAKDKGRLGRGC